MLVLKEEAEGARGPMNANDSAAIDSAAIESPPLPQEQAGVSTAELPKPQPRQEVGGG